MHPSLHLPSPSQCSHIYSSHTFLFISIQFLSFWKKSLKYINSFYTSYYFHLVLIMTGWPLLKHLFDTSCVRDPKCSARYGFPKQPLSYYILLIIWTRIFSIMPLSLLDNQSSQILDVLLFQSRKYKSPQTVNTGCSCRGAGFNS